MTKNRLIYLCMLSMFMLISTYDLLAQSWTLGGNADAKPDSKIGTLTALPLRFTTNNTERFRIDVSGNIGIGTLLPSYKFHVVGSSLFSPNIIVTADGSIPEMPINYFLNSATYGQQMRATVKVRGEQIGVYTEGTEYGMLSNGRIEAYTNSIAIIGRGDNTGIIGHGYQIGIKAMSSGKNSVGVQAQGVRAGVYGYGSRFGIYGESANVGIYSRASNTGVFAYGDQSGIIAMSTYGNGGSFTSTIGAGIYASSRADFAGVFGGSIRVDEIQTVSDISLKKNIQPVSNALGIINKLKPKLYEFRNEGRRDSIKLPKGIHYGFIAQDVEQVLPNLVKQSDITPVAFSVPDTSDVEKDSLQSFRRSQPKKTMVKSVNYIEFIPLLVKALQEQQEQINVLVKEIKSLKRLPGADSAYIPAELAQIVPNPAKDTATIRYKLPVDIQYAELVFRDSADMVVMALQLDMWGFARINVSNLSNGVYNYSLVVDNKKVLTKRMEVKR